MLLQLLLLACIIEMSQSMPNEAFRDALRVEIRDTLREEIRDDLREEIIDDLRGSPQQQRPIVQQQPSSYGGGYYQQQPQQYYRQSYGGYQPYGYQQFGRK
jgi:hypothetical protein